MPKSKLPAGWPWGAGSMQRRGHTWWMIYRNLDGRIVQENSKEVDYDPAFRMLIERALVVARARVARIEEIAREAKKPKARRVDPSDRQARDSNRQPARRRSVRDDAALRGDGKTTTKRGHRQ